MASLRTYRMVASVLSVLLLLSTVLPLIQQVCCDDIASQPAEPPCHDMATDAMHDMQADAMSIAMNHTGVQDDCCLIQSAQTPILPSVLLKEATPRPVLHPVLLAFSTPRQPFPTAQPSHVLADASPPATPLSLHLLNGSFLN